MCCVSVCKALVLSKDEASFAASIHVYNRVPGTHPRNPVMIVTGTERTFLEGELSPSGLSDRSQSEVIFAFFL